jgi:hypothetical protein
MMKKVFLIMISVILLSVSSNCQWYNRRYGVSDISQLSLEQLNLALANAKFEFASGIFLSVVGAIGLYGGIQLSKSAPPGDIGGALAGIIITVVSIPAEIAGWIILSINRTRAKSIKEVLKSTELKLGLVNYQRGNIYSGSQGSLIPCLSVTICF